MWLLTCILFVFMALLEYALLLYWKNMKGVCTRIVENENILDITPLKVLIYILNHNLILRVRNESAGFNFDPFRNHTFTHSNCSG